MSSSCMFICGFQIHTIENRIGRTYVYSKRIYKHVILMTINNLGQVEFSILFLLMLHRSYAKAKQSTAM